MRQSLTRTLSKQGRIRFTNDLKLLKARKLYVIDLWPLQKISEELRVDQSVLNRWCHLHNWVDDRTEREKYLYQRVSGIRRKLVPDIDARHDQLFGSLEALLETTIRELTDAGVAVPPHQLKTLASTAKTCQEARRIVHKKESVGTRNVLEIQDNPEMYENFVRSLVDLGARQGDTAAKRIHVQDVEFEVVGDADAGSSDETEG